jgi:hypothetical protein
MPRGLDVLVTVVIFDERRLRRVFTAYVRKEKYRRGGG